MKIARSFTPEDASHLPNHIAVNWPDDEIASFDASALFQAVPTHLKPVEENTLPSWLWRHVPNGAAKTAEKKPENVFKRVVGAATYAGWKKDLFANEDEARCFYDELIWAFSNKLIIAQPSALPYIGTDWAYGLKATTETIQKHPKNSLSLENREIDELLAESNPVAQARWNRLLKNVDATTPLTIHFKDTAEEWGDPTASAFLPLTINLPLLSRETDGAMNGPALQHVTRLSVILLDLLMDVEQAAPSDSRALSLGFCGLAEFLLSQGLSYDSPAARATASALSSIISATAVETSAYLAQAFGTCAAFNAQRAHHLRIIANRRRAAYGDTNDYEHVSVLPLPLTLGDCPDLSLVALTRHAWDQAIVASQRYGVRHTQLTALPPFPSLSSFVKEATAGLAPMTTLVREKQIAVEEFIREIHPLVPKILARLNYEPSDIKAMIDHAVGYNTLIAAPGISLALLKDKGFTDEALARLEAYLPRVKHISQAFTPWVLGYSFCKNTLKIAPKKLDDYAFDLLKHLGFSSTAIKAANNFCCGHGTLANALELKDEHKPLFADAENLAPASILAMAASVQCFVTGEIDLTLSLSPETKTEDRADCVLSAWRKGLKNVRLAVDFTGNAQTEKSKTKPSSLRLRRRASTGRPAPQSAHSLTEAMTTPSRVAKSKASPKVIGLSKRPSSRLHKTGR